ncbi:MAG: FkbM family methyltransferase [Crocinitomicaceae bacterium]|nr:FkbM family methyltransferase [Crocinitomicaceae bacterium]
MSTFQDILIAKILANINNNFEVNPDLWYANSNYTIRKNIKIGNFKDRLVQRNVGKYYCSKRDLEQLLANIFDNGSQHYEFLYNLLADQQSKDTLIEIVAFRLLGPKKIQLSIENDSYKSIHELISNSIIERDYQKLEHYPRWSLHKFDLSSINMDLKIYYSTMGIVTTFGVEQYRYKHLDIAPKEGATILDCGGCWGDTALYFDRKVKNAKIFTFEFVPSNIELLNTNLALNNIHSVEVIEQPVGKISGSVYHVVDKGPSSTLSDTPSEGSFEVETISIDDLVVSKAIGKVDFIKMDIEGAELIALEGARETILKYSPTLVLAIYHYPCDFDQLPRFIHDLNPDYRFYLGHNTPHQDETVLFACVKENLPK